MPTITTGPVEVEDAVRLRLAVGRLARQLRQHAARGLTPSQLSALFSIEHFEPIRLGDLATREAVAPPTLTRIVQNLVEAGLVERRVDPADGRSAQVVTTKAGRVALQKVRKERTAVLVTRLARLSPEQRALVPAAAALLEALIVDVDVEAPLPVLAGGRP